MLRILLLCLLGLSSTSFAKTQSVLEQFFPRKTIDQNELQKKIEIAQKYVTPDNIQKIVQKSFDTNKETLEKLDLPKETLQDILDSICKEIILYSIRLDRKVSPLGLTFSLLKDAEKALKDENFALARLYTDLVVSIEHSSLGSQFVQIKEGQNLESIDQIATIASLCHTYAILGLIKNKQIKNGNHEKFVDIDKSSSNTEISHISKEYIQALYELIGIRFQNRFNTDKEYLYLSDTELKSKIFDSLCIPELFTICNEDNTFDKEKYNTYQEFYLEHLYTNLKNFRSLNIKTDFQKNFERLLKDEEWYNIAKKPPIGISTPLTRQDLQNKLEEFSESQYSCIIDALEKNKESYAVNSTNDLVIAEKPQFLSQKLVNIEDISENLKKILPLIESLKLLETSNSNLSQDSNQRSFQQKLEDLELYLLCFNKLYFQYAQFLMNLVKNNPKQENNDKILVLTQEISEFMVLAFHLEDFIEKLYDKYTNEEEEKEDEMFKTKKSIFKQYSVKSLDTEIDNLDKNLDLSSLLLNILASGLPPGQSSGQKTDLWILLNE